MEQTTAPGDSVFVRIEFFTRYGDALLNDHTRTAMLSLDDLCGLIASRLAVIEAAEAAASEDPPRATKPRKAVRA